MRAKISFLISISALTGFSACRHDEGVKESVAKNSLSKNLGDDVTVWRKTGGCLQQGKVIFSPSTKDRTNRSDAWPDQFYHDSQPSSDLANKTLEELVAKADDFHHSYCEKKSIDQPCVMKYTAEAFHLPRKTEIRGFITEINGCFSLAKLCSTKGDAECLNSKIRQVYEEICKDRLKSIGSQGEMENKLEACVKSESRKSLNLRKIVQIHTNWAKAKWSHGNSLEEELEYRKRHASPDMLRAELLTGLTYVTTLRGGSNESEEYIITLDQTD